MVSRWLIRLCLWYLRRKGRETDSVPATVVALAADAADLVKRQQPVLSSGEAKRHQVYARMIKLHPDAAHRDIGWAIERAVRRRL